MWAVAAAVTMLLSVPLAVASSALGEKAPEIVVHVVLGTGMLLFVRAVFDFALPRWINLIGALFAGAFAGVFLLQAASRILPENAALENLAFGLLGNWPELVLVLGVDVWFLGLLLLGTEGRTRLLGWALIPILTGYHLISLAGIILAISVPSLGVISLLLPFVWLLIEGAKRGEPAGFGPRRRGTEHVEAPAA
ncbi:MAG: hypothetical protein ACJ761_10245 [Chloroflexota bacterium]